MLKERPSSFCGKLRFLYNAHCYGGIYVYCTVWTILKQFLVLFAALFGVDQTRDELVEEVQETFKKKFEIPDEYQLTIGETARSLFYAFLLSLDLDEDDIVLTTPLQHYSFIRIYKALNLKTITVDMKPDGSGWDWETFFKHVTPDQAERIKCCIVTHMFGYNQNYDECIDWCEKNDVFIFEDCIQGYTLFQNIGHPRAHMSVYSGGCDKIPCTTKGGFGIVRNNEKIYKRVMSIISNLPEKPWEKRFKDLVSQFMYWFLTATKSGTFVVISLGLFKQGLASLWEIIHWVRKNFLKAYVGKFTLDRVSYRPSIYHLRAMVIGCQRSEKYFVDMLHDSREKFRQIIGQKYSDIMFPWANGNDVLEGHANLYFHCLVRERDELLESMSQKGWGMCYQQAWDCCTNYPSSGHPEPIYSQMLKENMAYLPLCHQMLDSEIEAVAEIAKAHIDKHHPDGKPFHVVDLDFAVKEG